MSLFESENLIFKWLITTFIYSRSYKIPLLVRLCHKNNWVYPLTVDIFVSYIIYFVFASFRDFCHLLDWRITRLYRYRTRIWHITTSFITPHWNFKFTSAICDVLFNTVDVIQMAKAHRLFTKSTLLYNMERICCFR